MEAIHVLTGNLPGIVAEMVHQTLQQQPDIDWLGSLEQWQDIETVIHQADVLILGADNVYSLPEPCFRLLEDCPDLKIFLLPTAGNEAIAYWRALHCQQISVISSRFLIESIRQIIAVGGRGDRFIYD